MLKDLRRLITFTDFLYYLGDVLSKKSLRYTGFTAMVSLLGYLGGLLPGVDTYSAKVAIALPLLVGTATFAGGMALRSIPMFLASRAMSVAQAQDLDLMEDYRKWREEAHLERLWERVFCFEWALGTESSRIRPHPEEAPPELCGLGSGTGDGGWGMGEEGPGFRVQDSESIARRSESEREPQPNVLNPESRTLNPPRHPPPVPRLPPPGQDPRQQFLARARFALARPQPQPRQRYHLGIDMRYLEDWRNGGYFDRGDTKLLEQFDASATILAVKAEVGYGTWDALVDLPGRLIQRFWFFLITRAVGVQSGEAIAWLNRQYDTDYFNAQVLLWPGEDQQPWLGQFHRAVDNVRQKRRDLLTRIFGADDESARRILRRMLLPSVWRAAKLRARYDPEYLDGSLGFDLASDLEQSRFPTQEIERYRVLGREVAAESELLAPWLRRYRPELLSAEEGEALRAARVAVHVRREHLRPMIRGDQNDPAACERFSAYVLPVVDAAARARARYSSRLVGLRVHHELTRLHSEEYLNLLGSLRNVSVAP